MKEYKISICVVSVILCIVGYVVSNAETFNLCNGHVSLVSCPEPIFQVLGIPLAIISVILFLFSFWLIFLRDEVFVSWLKLSALIIPISVILAILTLMTAPHEIFWMSTQVAFFLSFFLFPVSSLILIIYKSIKLKGK